MRSHLIILLFCLVYICCSNSGRQAPDITIHVNEDGTVMEQQNLLRTLWNEITDSMVVLEKLYFRHDTICHRLIEESGKLNKEEKVFELLSSSLSANHTLYFINWFSIVTRKYTFSFWDKDYKEKDISNNIYTYRYYHYKKNLSSFINEYGDSVKIYNTNELNNYSDEFLSLCNKWDTIAIKRSADLLSPLREDEHIIVFMVNLKKGNKFTIHCVPIMKKSYGDNIGSPTYEVISDG